jgi:hypothetical protein
MNKQKLIGLCNKKVFSRIPEGELEDMNINDHIANMCDMRLGSFLSEDMGKVERSQEVLELSCQFRDKYKARTLRDVSELLSMTGIYSGNAVQGIYGFGG